MEFLLNFGYNLSLFLIPIVLYTVFFKQNTKHKKDWLYIVRYYFAKKVVLDYQKKSKINLEALEICEPTITDQMCDCYSFKGLDEDGNSITLKFTVYSQNEAEIDLTLEIDSVTYTLSNQKTVLLNQNLWRSKDLQIDVLEPFRRIRVTYNGFLAIKNSDPVHVQLNFLWVTTSRPLCFPNDIPTVILAEAIAMERWRDGEWFNLLGDTSRKGYEQFGTITALVRGTPFVSTNDITLRLASVCSRYWGVDLPQYATHALDLFVNSKDGYTLSLHTTKIKNGVANLKFGHIIYPDFKIGEITSTDLNLEELIGDSINQLPELFTIHLKMGKKTKKIVFHFAKFVEIKLNGGDLVRVTTNCDVDACQGRGLIDFFWFKNVLERKTTPPISDAVNIKFEDVLSLNDCEAKKVETSGGKGSSLAILASLATNKFVVPSGFILTVKIFDEFISYNTNVKETIDELERVVCQNEENYENFCKKTVTIIQNATIPKSVISHVSEKIQNAVKNTRWAVRSSGICEDLADLSAAGQNSTFLGCQSANDVILAISHCWASLYTYKSVKYRHQHGLPIKSKMAVVIQEMVDAESAGVLFTCHPSTGNVGEMIITANHGLGESVVSGVSDPDTIVFSRQCGTNAVSIKTKSLGTKNTIYRMRKNGNGIETVCSATNTESISDSVALQLAHIGIYLENVFQEHCDIEWAYFNSQIYILQARPITTLFNWSDFELLHEFDVPNLTNDVCYSVANTGEVFPGCISTLTLTTIVKCFEEAIQINMFNDFNSYISNALPIFQGHVFVDVLSIHRAVSKEISLQQKALDLTIFGHTIICEEIRRLSEQKNGCASTFQLAGDFIKMAKFAWNNNTFLKQLKNDVSKLEIGLNDFDSLETIYQKIDVALQNEVPTLFKYHGQTTTVSIFYQMITLTVLAKGSQDFTNKHYNDISLILSSCDDVISAEIPAILEQLAGILQNTPEFCRIAPNEALEYLKENNQKAWDLLSSFLQKHGHRTIGEFDLLNETWSMAPDKVVQMIKANNKGLELEEKPKKLIKSIAEIISELETPKSLFTKKMLRFLIGKCRATVGIREQSKSEVVKVVHKIRIAYRKLANKMTEFGLIPYSNLIFHLSHTEVGSIIQKSPKSHQFIIKALRRQRLYPNWSKIKFPEINYGAPKEIGDFHWVTGNGKVCLKGTPVCSGNVRARACVIDTLDEIEQLQNGDILVTYSTDIGWSPYFPMLAGIVTELGGLVSHGAVIAREYGLPSIVGVEGATKAFKTGDFVILSGKGGTIEIFNDLVEN